MDHLEQTVEIPKETIQAQIEEMRRRALVNAGLVHPMGMLPDGFMTRRQAS